MKIIFHQTLVAMSDTFHRATGDEKMADTMKDAVFCREIRIEEVRLIFPNKKSKAYLSLGCFIILECSCFKLTTAFKNFLIYFVDIV
jgi:hypothetical protein